MRRRRLVIQTRNNAGAQDILTRQGYHAAETVGGFIELTDRPAIDHPDKISSILVHEGMPPTALWEKEEDLESLFMNMINQETIPHG